MPSVFSLSPRPPVNSIQIAVGRDAEMHGVPSMHRQWSIYLGRNVTRVHLILRLLRFQVGDICTINLYKSQCAMFTPLCNSITRLRLTWIKHPALWNSATLVTVLRPCEAQVQGETGVVDSISLRFWLNCPCKPTPLSKAIPGFVEMAEKDRKIVGVCSCYRKWRTCSRLCWLYIKAWNA